MFKVLSSWFGFSLCILGYFCATNNPALAEARLALEKETASRLLAQVTSDDTVNTQVTENGKTAEITGGETRGDNLFHSFQDFSVKTGNEAFFNNADSISNIFSRVTGGKVSDIDGAIRANGSANLFLINPAGILFGENARLDIGGSFYGSSASSILFEDGEFSAADLDNPPLLTVNAPIGLGFRDNPGDIVNRSIAKNSAGEFGGLEVLPGNNLALIGGNINFETGEVSASGGNIQFGGQVSASGGNIHLGGLSQAGIVSMNKDGSLSFPDDVAKADITLSNGASIDALGTGGGNIAINARNLSLTKGEFGNNIRAGITFESTSAQAQAGDVTINVTDKITLDGSNISNENLGGVGNSGKITINTGSLEAINGGEVSTDNRGQGNAGSINITATGDLTFDGDNLDAVGFPSGVHSIVKTDAVGNAGKIVISSRNLTLAKGGFIAANTFGEGNAGSVDLTATGNLTFDGEDSLGISSGVESVVDLDAKGDAGDINITTNSLSLTNGGRVSASTKGQGNAGSINIKATGDMNFDGENSSGVPSGVTSQFDTDAVGNAGGVTISTNNLNLTKGGRVDASTFGQGDAGAVNINAINDITFDGEDLGGIPSGVTSQVDTDAVGNAGGVTISTSNLTLTNGGIVSASTSGQGNAGAVNITATGNLTFDGETSDGSQSAAISLADTDAVGNAGGVTIETNNLTLTKGGAVSASTLGQGDAGLVKITATGDLTFDGENSRGFPSGAISQVEADAEGNAGGVTISTNNLNLTNGGRVDASTFGQGDAGVVKITATGDLTFDGEDSSGFPSGATSTVTTDAKGNAGDVTIATNNLTLTNGGRVSATSNTVAGKPGNIFIEANNLDLANTARIDAATQSETGETGKIDLQIAEDITLQENSFISARAFKNADGGNLNIDARFIVASPSNGTGNDLVATAEQGIGGNINLNAEQIFGLETGDAINDETGNFIRNNNNDLDASSDVLGFDGTVNIDTSDVNPVQGATELPSNIVEARQTADQTCSADRDGKATNGLAIAGRGGIHPAPDTPLNSENISQENPAQASIPQPLETSRGKIQPARGIKVSESGKISLTAYRTDNAGERIPEIKPNCN